MPESGVIQGTQSTFACVFGADHTWFLVNRCTVTCVLCCGSHPRDAISSCMRVIQEAQSAAARIFGADHTWFLVNGCTVGIHAAVMAVAK
eukprot:scaffold64367_cov21-Tisochrysis_lutea.AAC.1